MSPTIDWDFSDFYTPTPAPQTPTPVSDPDGDGEGCPDVPVLSDDVTPLYARECRRCVDDLQEPPQSQLQIPTRRISTPVAGGDYVFGTATSTGVPTLVATATRTLTVTSTIMPIATLTATPSDGWCHSNFDFDDLNDLTYNAGQSYTGDYFASSLSYPSTGVGGTTALRADPGSGDGGAAFAGMVIDVPAGLSVAGWSFYTYVPAGGSSIVYTRHHTSAGWSARVSLGTPGQSTWGHNYRSLSSTLTGIDKIAIEVHRGPGGASAYAMIDQFDLAYVCPPTPTPSHTPTATPVAPTATIQPTQTAYWGIRTPRPNGGDEAIDCRIPLWRDKTPIFRLPELKVIGSACYRVVPLIDLDLSSYSIPLVDTSWVPPVQVNPVDLCVTWQLIGDFAFMGMSVPFDILFALPLLAFLWRLLYRF